MSFSVKDSHSGLEYNGHNLNTLFAQRKQLLNPSFIRFALSILKFNNLALAAAENNLDQNITLEQFLKVHGLLGSGALSENKLLHWYLLPMAAAIWSTSPEAVLQFPAHFFIQFFKHHGLLELKNRPQWYSVTGGSRTYVQALVAKTTCNWHLDTQIKTIHRHTSSSELVFEDDSTQTFDYLILACHSDQALQLLAQPTPDERHVLGRLRYSSNQAVLHTDASVMPEKELAWASWNYLLTHNTDQSLKNADKPIVTYDMRRLQSLPAKSPLSQPILVSLNAQHLIDPSKILKTIDYSHPQFDADTSSAQNDWPLINNNQTFFCGAYWFNGFHEDGVKSGLRVAKKLGDYHL